MKIREDKRIFSNNFAEIPTKKFIMNSQDGSVRLTSPNFVGIRKNSCEIRQIFEKIGEFSKIEPQT